MKKLYFIVAMMAGTAALSSCKQSEDAPAPVINSNTPGAGWHITRFTEPGEDKTNDYNGYVFEFASNGTASAVFNSQTSTGSWSQSSSDGLHRFEIQFSTTDKKVEKLNHKWVLVKKSDAFMSMTDDNVSSDEHLEFSK